MLELQELTSLIIGAGIEVHRTLGPGYLESIYENAMAIELKCRGVAFKRQVRVQVVYQGIEVGSHRVDLLIEELIVVELKAIRKIAPVHYSIVRSYLKALGLTHGLLLNFYASRLQPKRVIHDPRILMSTPGQ